MSLIRTNTSPNPSTTYLSLSETRKPRLPLDIIENRLAYLTLDSNNNDNPPKVTHSPPKSDPITANENRNISSSCPNPPSSKQDVHSIKEINDLPSGSAGGVLKIPPLPIKRMARIPPRPPTTTSNSSPKWARLPSDKGNKGKVTTSSTVMNQAPTAGNKPKMGLFVGGFPSSWSKKRTTATVNTNKNTLG